MLKVVCCLNIILVYLIAFPINLFATDYVYDGEFVIEENELNDSVVPFNFQSSAVSDFTPVKEIGNSTLLIKKNDNIFSLRSSSSVQDVNSENVRAVDQSDLDFCDELVTSGRVKSCSPNYKLYALMTPNDTDFNTQWGLSDSFGIGASKVWDKYKGSDDVVVAVVDTGIDYNHVDLAQNIWVNKGEIPNNGIDDDNNGYVDDVYGFSAVSGDSSPSDKNGHGTHVAGIIGAVGNNGVGVAGVNWNVKIMSSRFLNKDGVGSMSGAIEAINYIIAMKKNGVNVVAINNSWGGGAYSKPLENAIKKVADYGMSFIVAAGNEGISNDANPNYPANYRGDNIISVAAIGRNQTLAEFSNFGNSVDIAAPGVSIYSTYLNNKYMSMSGTSMATPFVTGAVALLKSIYPDLTPAQIKNRILSSGTKVDALENLVATSKVLNLYSAVYSSGQEDQETVSCIYTTEERFQENDIENDDNSKKEFLSNSDEKNYKSVKLAFPFKFYGVEHDSILVSPNGVIYFDNQSEYDYRNDVVAPFNSLAALHTDLLYPKDGEGVYSEGNETYHTIIWKGESYSSILNGEVTVTATLYPSGKIEVSYIFSDDKLASLVSGISTVGISGKINDRSNTYSHNDVNAIYTGLVLTFNADCNSKEVNNNPANGDKPSSINTPEDNQDDVVKEPILDTLHISAYTKKGKSSKKAIPNSKIKVEAIGDGDGNVPLYLYLNGKQCGTSFGVELENGYGKKDIKLPTFVKYYKKIIVKAGTKKSNVLMIKNQVNVKNIAKKKLSKKAFARSCAMLVRQLNK